MKLHLLPQISTNLYMDVMKSWKAPTSMKVAKHLMIHKTFKKQIERPLNLGGPYGT